MKNESVIPSKYLIALAWALALFGLYLTSLHSYLLFHSLAEIFSIVVACAIFMVAWNSRQFLDNNYLLFIGIAYLFVGGFDLLHTLAYKGMGVLPGYGANLPTQLWIATRYIESLSLLIAPVFIGRKLSPRLILTGYSLVTAVLLGTIFYWRIFPDCFLEGVGLTPFKKISEYLISVILAGSIALLVRKQKAFDRHVLRLLVASIFLTIAAELAFTFYVSVYGISNLFGHFCKIISFYLIYKAIIETGLRKPYDLLFRDLKQSEEAQREARDELELRVEERTADLVEANERLRQEIEERKRIEEALRNSEKKYRALINDASDSIVLTDTEGNVLDTNKKALELFGYSKDELLQKNVAELHPKEVLERTFMAFKEAVHSGSGSLNDTKILRKDGKTVPVDITGSVIRYGDQRVVQGFFRDITERKRAESIVRNIAEGVSASTGEVFFQSLVRQLAQMLEMDYALVGELIDQKEENVETVAVWAHNDIVDNFNYELANTPCQNVVGKALCCYPNNVQEQFPLDHLLQEMNVECYVGVPLFDSRGGPLGIMALLDGKPLENPEFVESTLRVFAARASAELERRLAEAAIRQAEKQYRLLVQNLPSIVYKGYKDWSVDFFDMKIESLLGYNLEDFSSRKMKWSEVILEEDLEHASSEFVQAMKGDKSYVREYRIKTKGGDILWIQDRGHIVCDEAGEIEYLSGVFFDITDRKQMDEALQKSEKELRFLSAELLNAQESERARFARELHDGIGQALSTMKVRVEALAKIAESDVSRLRVEDLENLVPMLRQTIEEVRNTCMDLRPSTLDSLGIVPTINWFSREFQTAYPFIQIEKKIDILEAEVPDVLKIVIYRIVQEAFNNAARHSGAEILQISLAKTDGEIRLAVQDNGQGFDLEDLLSADTAKRCFGLTSMKERAELSGGSFSIESGIGRGTTILASWKV
jgi:PAS domain S-box-containing protein